MNDEEILLRIKIASIQERLERHGIWLIFL